MTTRLDQENGASGTITLRVRRSDGGKGSWSVWQVPAEDRMTVLDALFWVLRYRDRSLAFRCACRAAMCGSCAVVVNGSERLACKTPLASLGDTVAVEPLRHLPVVKDLVVDPAPFFAAYERIAPAFDPDPGATEPALVPAGAPRRRAIDDHLSCITCGACFSACPMIGADGQFAGPAALQRAFTLLADERATAQAGEARWVAVAGDRHGIWRCHGLAECSRVCPKQLDPSGAIRALKRLALLGST
ncbi:MAG: succinate dehydrogenase/fumarate reductase iron-sulfur subunit [Chloroflexi bacterium]|nr:succinate dehydrogenase/fumarate reductase iron-sulfur subunit [Chloroflexota bacterium]